MGETVTNKRRTKQKYVAKYLIVMKGYAQSEAAKVIGVSENTLSAWKKKYRWKTYEENLRESKRLKARHLIVVEGYSQKEAAEKIGMSENIISLWAIEYNWNEQKKTAVDKTGAMEAYFNDFREYVRSCEPEMLKSIDRYWKGFIAKLEKEMMGE